MTTPAPQKWEKEINKKERRKEGRKEKERNVKCPCFQRSIYALFILTQFLKSQTLGLWPHLENFILQPLIL